jgi:apolipoprotein D and lipocalin family protein
MRLPSRQTLMLLGLAGAGAVVVAANRPRRNSGQPGITPIAALDLPRYMGEWYEIAKYPNRFEKDCVGFTTAHYSLQRDKTLRVVNRCRRPDGRFEEVVGAGRQLGGPRSPTLQVRFTSGLLSFLPMAWADYWVIDLDPDYRLAAVSEPEGETLWILARTPTVPKPELDALLGRLARQGFDLARLEMTRQTL